MLFYNSCTASSTMRNIISFLIICVLVDIKASKTSYDLDVSLNVKITETVKPVSSRGIFECALKCLETENCQQFSFLDLQKLCIPHSMHEHTFSENTDGWRTWMKLTETFLLTKEGHIRCSVPTVPFKTISFTNQKQDKSEILSLKHQLEHSNYPESIENTITNRLHEACAEGKLTMVRYILSKAKADINCRGKWGQTPIMMAAANGHFEVFAFLFCKGCDLSVLDDRNDTLLHSACAGGNVDIVRTLLVLKHHDTDSRGYHKVTPLIKAVYFGYKNVFDLLVSYGCNLTSVDNDGNNILHFASLGGHVEMVNYILTKDIFSIDSKGHYLKTPLMMAVEKGHTDVVDFLFRKGCNATAVNVFKNNILHMASIFGNVDMVKQILKQGKIHIDTRGSGGSTSVMLAIENGHRAVVELLVSKRCSLTSVNDIKDNILHVASYRGHVDMVMYILSLKVISIDSEGFRGRTAVMSAAEKGHKEVFDLLVRNGCCLTLVGKEGNTVLHFACMGGNVDIVKYLIRHSTVDRKVKNKYNRTPLQVAQFHGRKDIETLLRAWEE